MDPSSLPALDDLDVFDESDDSNVCSPDVEPTPVFTLEEYHSLRQKHLGVVTSSRPGDLISGLIDESSSVDHASFLLPERDGECEEEDDSSYWEEMEDIASFEPRKKRSGAYSKDVSKKMSTLLTRSANRALRDTRLSNQDHLAQSPSVSLEQTLETSNLTMMGSSKQIPTSAINPPDPKRVPSTRHKNSSTRIHERGKKRVESVVDFLPSSTNSSSLSDLSRGQFILANFRVVVGTGVYGQHLTDSDAFLCWDSVAYLEMLDVFGSSTSGTCQESSGFDPITEGYCCPICLHPPSAPMCTRCGHVFCAECIVRYLEKKNHFKKCPVCSFEYVGDCDLRPVVLRYTFEVSPGSELQFDLCYRVKGTTVVRPIESAPHRTKQAKFRCHLPCINDSSSRFCRVVYAGEINSHQVSLSVAVEASTRAIQSVILDHVDRLEDRRNHLLSSAENEDDYLCSEIPSIDHSLNLLRSQAASWEKKLVDALSFSANPNAVGDYSSFDDLDDQDMPSFLSFADIEVTEHDLQKSMIYFYFANDGQLLFLDPLCAKILWHEYGSFESFPHRISGRVIDIYRTTQSEELRRRFKYLSFLPLTSSLSFVELDMRNLVSSSTYKLFEPDIILRRKRRVAIQKQIEREMEIQSRLEERFRAERLLLEQDYGYLFVDRVREGDESFIPSAGFSLDEVFPQLISPSIPTPSKTSLKSQTSRAWNSPQESSQSQEDAFPSLGELSSSVRFSYSSATSQSPPPPPVTSSNETKSMVSTIQPVTDGSSSLTSSSRASRKKKGSRSKGTLLMQFG